MSALRVPVHPHRLDLSDPLEAMQMRADVRMAAKLGRPALADQVGVADARRIADAGQHRAGSARAEARHELVPQRAERRHVEHHHPLAVKPDPPILRAEGQHLEQFGLGLLRRGLRGRIGGAS
jgi:hypothetical protein